MSDVRPLLKEEQNGEDEDYVEQRVEEADKEFQREENHRAKKRQPRETWELRFQKVVKVGNHSYHTSTHLVADVTWDHC